MRATVEVLLLAVRDHEGVHLHGTRLPVPHAPRDGLRFEQGDLVAVAHDGVRKNDVAHVREVQPGEALLEALARGLGEAEATE